MQSSYDRDSPNMTDDEQDKEVVFAEEKNNNEKIFNAEIVWGNVVKFAFLHVVGICGLFVLPFTCAETIAFFFITGTFSAMGVTAGVHRLWTHRSYKAHWPLRLLLVGANSMAAENSIYTWARDHRAHHKYSETDADPHNSNRGMFFAHMGWLLVRKHPDVIRKGSKIDLSDLKSDPVVMFQHRHYLPLALLSCYIIPTVIPWALWGENLIVSYLTAFARHLIVLHNTWCVNSLAHYCGKRPYDKNIVPAENKLVSFLAMGEGFHNYHHTFPQDYSTSEWRYSLNLTTLFIDAMAFVGLAYDRKSVSQEAVMARIKRTG